MALRTLKSETAGAVNSNKATTWNGGELLAAGDDIELKGEATLTINALLQVRSVVWAEGSKVKVILKTGVEILLGDAGNPVSGWAWKCVSTGSFTKGTGSIIRLHSTYKGGPQKIKTAGFDLGEIQAGGAGVTEATYVLEDDLKCLNSGVTSILLDGGEWDWNGHNIEAWSFETGATKQKPRAGKLVLTGSSASISILHIEEATIWEGAECTIEFTDTSTTLKKIGNEPSSRTLASVFVVTNNTWFNAAAGEMKVGTFRANTAPGAIGVKFDLSYKLIVTAGFTVNSTEEAHRVIMFAETAVEAEAWKLVNETGGNVSVDFVELKGAKSEGGSCYAGTHSVKSTNVTGWKFEAPSGKKTVEEASTTRSGASASALARLLATAPALMRSGARPSAVAVKLATASAASSTGTRAALFAVKLVSASASAATGVRSAASALKAAQGSATSMAGTRTLSSASRLVISPAASAAGSRAQAQGRLLATSSATSRTGATCRVTVSGQKTVEEASLSRSGARSALQALKLALGTGVTRTGARSGSSTARITQSAVTTRTGARASAGAQLITRTTAATRTGARAASTTHLAAVGIATSRTGALSLAETPADAFVEIWTVRGSSTLYPTTAGDMPVVYSSAGDEVAIPTYAGDDV